MLNPAERDRQEMQMSDEEIDPDAPTPRGAGKAKNGKNAAKLAEMKAKLAALLAKPITQKGLSHRYLTAGGLQGSAWVDDMVRGGNHEQIIGVQNTDAKTDVQSKQTQPAKKKQKLAEDKGKGNKPKVQQVGQKDGGKKLQKREPNHK